jgi:hypothetical protein
MEKGHILVLDKGIKKADISQADCCKMGPTKA